MFVPPADEGRSFVDPPVGERRVDGAVLVDRLLGDPFVDAVRAAGLPFVTIGRLLDGSSDVWVDNDHASICAGVAEHLKAAGYERPALLTIETDVSYGADCVAGFRTAFPQPDRIVVADAFSARRGLLLRARRHRRQLPDMRLRARIRLRQLSGRSRLPRADPSSPPLRGSPALALSGWA